LTSVVPFFVSGLSSSDVKYFFTRILPPRVRLSSALWYAPPYPQNFLPPSRHDECITPTSALCVTFWPRTTRCWRRSFLPGAYAFAGAALPPPAREILGLLLSRRYSVLFFSNTIYLSSVPDIFFTISTASSYDPLLRHSKTTDVRVCRCHDDVRSVTNRLTPVSPMTASLSLYRGAFLFRKTAHLSSHLSRVNPFLIGMVSWAHSPLKDSASPSKA